MKRAVLLLPIALGLAACQNNVELHDIETSLVAANHAAGHAFGPEISTEDLAAHIKVLASDDFAGREPGTSGEEKTLRYLREQLQRLGLAPGNGDSYFQTVPMLRTTLDTTHSTVSFRHNEKSEALVFGEQMVIGTRSGQATVTVANSPVVFVGYGVNAPALGWNDYAGLDVKGKTVVMLINDPGFHSGDASLFEGRRMTYYGRWTYKFEEAARQGAAAAIIIHDTAGAGYGWGVVNNGWTGPQFDLPAKDDPEPRLPVQGWITGEAAQSLFADAGLDLEQLRQAAGKRGFRPVALADTRLDASLRSDIATSQSRNVIAKLPGSKYPDEAIVYTAHWDHLGTHADEAGDNIYNGAIDNGSGLAGVLEIAEKFTVQDPKPERSLIFLLPTLEESGLLGSKYYVAHPSVPLSKTVAVINLDDMPPIGRTHDLVAIGLGNSELDDLLRGITERQDRVLVAESSPEKGYFFRSDHFSFAKAGVPALYAKGGTDLIEKGQAAGQAALDDYTATRYHKPADQFDANWDLRGNVEDLEAIYLVGKTLSLNRAWPNYREGNAFRAARDASRKSAEERRPVSR